MNIFFIITELHTDQYAMSQYTISNKIILYFNCVHIIIIHLLISCYKYYDNEKLTLITTFYTDNFMFVLHTCDSYLV